MTRPFAVGDESHVEFTVSEELIDRFTELTGDRNPLHCRLDAARKAGFQRRVAHGAMSVGFLSTLIGMQLPGEGALWQSLRVEWLAPVFAGDSVRLTARIERVARETGTLALALSGTNQSKQTVLRGEAVVGTSAAPMSQPVAKSTSSPSVTAMPGGAAGPSSAGARPVLVTGGSGGIGQAICRKIAAHGHPVIVAFRQARDKATDIVEQIESAGGNARAVLLDMEDQSSVARSMREAGECFGPVLGLVHCASPDLDFSAPEDTDQASLERFFRVYVGSTLTACQAMYESIRKAGWGRLILIGTSALIGPPPPKMTPYVIGKSALWGLTKCLAVEWGRVGATANMISPGMTATDLIRGVSARIQLVEAQKNPCRRLAQPEDTAALAVFLLSDGAAYLNGVHLPLTGGGSIL